LGGTGGSGIVVISYSSAYAQLSSIGAGVIYSYSVIGGNHVYVFTAGSDSITWAAANAPLTINGGSGLTFSNLPSAVYTGSILSYNPSGGAVNYSSLSLGTLGAADSNTMNANWVTSGGGTITWDGTTGVVSGTARIIAIPVNNALATDGYLNIGSDSGSWSITLGSWSAAYWVPNSIPSGYLASQGSVQVIPYTSVGNQIASNWIFICAMNNDTSPATLKWGPGFVNIPHGGVYNSQTGGQSWNLMGTAATIALGTDAGGVSQGAESIAIGLGTAYSSQQTGAIAIGSYAGFAIQGAYAVAIGSAAAAAGGTSQGTNAVAIGNTAAYTSQGENGVAIGLAAAYTSQGVNAVAIGTNAGNNTQGVNAVAIGYGSGQGTQRSNAIAIGYQAGYSAQGSNGVSIGILAGQYDQGSNNVAIGCNAGLYAPNPNCIAIGTNAGANSGHSNTIAIGLSAGYVSARPNTIAIGTNAGSNSQLESAIAIGINAGSSNQGNNAIAIGNSAGYTSQSSNSIILNATGSTLNTSVQGFIVAPVRQQTGDYVMAYNTTTNEISYTSTSSSDKRLKKDISDTQLGLSFINQLRPVQFKWADRNTFGLDMSGNCLPSTAPGVRVHQGLIAQEVKTVLDSMGIDSAIYISISSPPITRTTTVRDVCGNTTTSNIIEINPLHGVQGLRYEELISPIIQSVKDLYTLVQTQALQIQSLQQTISNLMSSR
jgi:hypothetical protein